LEENGETFRNYAEGDARDVLLIFLDMFNLNEHVSLLVK
jgi:hypothetical protein